jgi:hypothetical protein
MADEAPTSEARVAAQRRFLEIAHELEPRLARSLYEDVLPEYPNHLEALRAWLGKWNFFEDWQLEHATQSIKIWSLPHRKLIDYDPVSGWPVYSASCFPALQPLPPLDVSWDHLTPLDKAKEDAMWAADEYKKEITKYYNAMSATASGEDPDRHIRWLVRRKILGEAYVAIARKDSGVSADAVRKGVILAESLIGTLRNFQPELEVRDDDPDDIHYVK